MKPTISNAFRDSTPGASNRMDINGVAHVNPEIAGGASPESPSASDRLNAARNSRSAELASMQVDLRETEFGWSLEMSPMQALDALESLDPQDVVQPSLNFLVSMEQSAWRISDADMPLAKIAQRLNLTPIDAISDIQLVLDEASLRELVSVCQPTRLLVVAIDGPIELRDAEVINKSIDAGRSPLLCELRATAALEVLGDRNVVLHSRSRDQALAMVAENFRHYLAARMEKPLSRFSAPQTWQIQRLLDESGMLTVRPIETQIFSTSIDVGVNTSRERFDAPARRSLIYDRPSDSWHDEP
jgi:hypothetical protein